MAGKIKKITKSAKVSKVLDKKAAPKKIKKEKQEIKKHVLADNKKFSDDMKAYVANLARNLVKDMSKVISNDINQSNNQLAITKVCEVLGYSQEQSVDLRKFKRSVMNWIIENNMDLNNGKKHPYFEYFQSVKNMLSEMSSDIKEIPLHLLLGSDLPETDENGIDNGSVTKEIFTELFEKKVMDILKVVEKLNEKLNLDLTLEQQKDLAENYLFKEVYKSQQYQYHTKAYL